MDSIRMSESEAVRNGLSTLLESVLDPHELMQTHVEVETALLIVEIAKRAEDRPEWFVRGKWATIQAIQAQTDEQLDQVFAELAKPKEPTP
jgi:hypothetical protein